MPDEQFTQEDVRELLEHLRNVKKQVDEARAALGPLEAGLAIAEREYSEHVSPYRNTASSLQSEIADLNAQIDRLEHPMTPQSQPDFFPRSEIDAQTEAEGVIASTAMIVAAPRDLDALEKDRLLEHLFIVLDGTADAAGGELIGMMTGLCTDPKITLGEVLEQLPWGEAWSLKRSAETTSDQYHRLEKWGNVLAQQLALLRRGEERLRRDNRFGLYRQRAKGSVEWQAFLDGASRQYQSEIAELQELLKERRQQWEEMLKAQ